MVPVQFHQGATLRRRCALGTLSLSASDGLVGREPGLTRGHDIGWAITLVRRSISFAFTNNFPHRIWCRLQHFLDPLDLMFRILIARVRHMHFIHPARRQAEPLFNPAGQIVIRVNSGNHGTAGSVRCNTDALHELPVHGLRIPADSAILILPMKKQNIAFTDCLLVHLDSHIEYRSIWEKPICSVHTKKPISI